MPLAQRLTDLRASPRLPWAILGVAGLLVFIAVTEDVLEQGSREELLRLDAVAGPATGGWGGTAQAVLGGISWLGSIAFMAPLFVALVLLLWRRGLRAEAARVAGLVLALQVGVAALKLLVARPRPAEAGVLELAGSFPSGHTATAALLACLVVWLVGRGDRHAWTLGLAAVGLAWVLLVGLSRLVLGVHYLTDVLAGMGLGLMVGGLGLAWPIIRSPRTPRA